MKFVGSFSSVFLTLLVIVSAEKILHSSGDNVEEKISNDKQRVPEVMEMEDEDFGNWTSLQDELDVYSSRGLARNWVEGKYPVNERCSKDITRYIKALKNKELWALKVDDASGRYTNGFFWGNSYFYGSATECKYIGKDYSKKRKLTMEAKSQETKKSDISGGNKLFYYLPDEAPYDLGFYMMSISLNASIHPTARVIHLGVCLPFSCTSKDVAIIGKLAAGDVAVKHSTIIKIRDQHNLYDMYEDPVFWILFGVTSGSVILMIIGTAYDLYLLRKIKHRKKVIYDLESHSKLEPLANGHRKEINEVIINGTIAVNNNNDNECNLRTPNPKLPQLTVMEELVLSFSVRSNLQTICDSTVGRDTLGTIHGLRALSMAWVILGHSCIVLFKYSDNMEYRKVVEKNFLFQTITNGAFSVDTFFFMGGLLVSFLYFRTNAKGDLNKLTKGTKGFVAGTIKFIGLLVYRFCRLTAPYMFILGLVQVSMKWFHANSIFEAPSSDHYNCPNYWWRNLLYINTLFPVEQMCMIWSWYVADDTQFYTIGAVILILATNHFKIAASAVATLLISSWLTTGYIALVNNHMPSFDDPLALFDKIYDKPWTRLGPYLIGMSVGYFLFKTDCKIKMSKATLVIGWLLSTVCLLSLVYGLYEAELTPITAAAYSSLSHSAWALGLAWIVVACSTGHGGFVNKILSAPILYPFSRVTYCAYLVHPILIRFTAMHLDAPFHLGKDMVFLVFLGQVCMSYFVSLLVSLTFEAPVVSMLKILSPKKRNRIQ